MTPEIQYNLYIAIRDGDIPRISSLLHLDGSGEPLDVNCRPFESLWHEPGPESTCLHLAACAIRADVVSFLLEHGADKTSTATGKTPREVVTAYDLFAPARIEREKEVERILELLA